MNKNRSYKGIVIEQQGLSYYAWTNYVTERHMLPWATTLAGIKAEINKAVAQ